eukprot:TRINITY_DN9553_c0_g1_i1.p1 TRINITY_DN9553_c0_g1~~TRINITY_DN9553_c0_g1_i1.p1  ORF type:complete len:472 (+),score=52.33 TRINITY_DN9553_c0_g1_i1:1-1416(+)
MLLRALWVVDCRRAKHPCVLLSRKFATVENRCRLSQTKNGEYIPIPYDKEFARLFAEALVGFDEKIIPCVHIPVQNGKLYPIIWYHQENEIYIVGLPFTEGKVQKYIKRMINKNEKLPDIISKPAITTTLCFLEDLSKFVEQFKPTYDLQQMAQVQTYISAMMPFGSPVDTNLANIENIHNGFPAQEDLPQGLKRPAWKPYLYKGKQRMRFVVRENIQAAQYDDKAISDTWNVHGTILCCADLENLPEVTVEVDLPKDPAIKVEYIAVDPKVQATDAVATKKLCCCPPVGWFSLCTYHVTGQLKLPFRGFYQMKRVGDREVKILAQLKLDSGVNNSFSYCRAYFPFPNRGVIKSVQANPTTGTVTLDEAKTTLVWNIGQKVLSRKLEVALPATVSFTGQPEIVDPFFVGANSYMQMQFKVVQYTLSGMSVNTKSLSIYPNSKVFAELERETIAKNYIIWNSLGKKKHVISS